MGERKIKVSMVVAQYNRADRIAESIGSALDQDFEDFEVVVVNDGSPDDNVRVELDKLNNDKLVVIHQENTGFVGAVRKAISASKGEYIAIHGAGDVSLPSRIRKQADYLDQHQNIGAIGCFYENRIFGKSDASVIQVRTNDRELFTVKDFEKNPIPYGHGDVMYRKALYDEVGGYRPFFKFAQDHDLWLRMASKADMALYPEVLYQRGYFEADGIATDMKKLVLQKYLSHFAIQLHNERKLGGKDSLDKIGPQAAFLRGSDKDLSQYFSWKALSHFYQGDKDMARYLAKLSVKEMISTKSLVVFALISLGQIELVHKGLTKLMSFHPREKKWRM
ncbi:glycosyltransferase family 2 protein [Agaribacter marinus]|uniref:Glycosyl transferase n=1 Tax=Agaribacter marinus TaxID=1431249 RepID=A0AA37T3F7_9ALTE|nr:glycosyltransferase family A protein [Agaribacter marinus]GLR72881.1 glycosyl transferase [Agaribacter marinus]